MPTTDDIDFLFPKPSHPPTLLCPQRWPGITPESTQTVRDILRDNYKRWHIFFNYIRFHNHAMHGTLAIWAMGGTAAVIEAGYEIYCKQNRRGFKSPEPITETNFDRHLGDEKYYDAFVTFYVEHARNHGFWETLQKFIFSREYNTPDREMLSRFLSGGMHPMIHVGYAAEMGLPVMLVEGLALASVHDADIARLFPQTFFNEIWAITDPTVPRGPSYTSLVANGIRGAASYVIPRLVSSSAGPVDDNVHALTILARVMADDTISQPADLDELRLVENTVLSFGNRIGEYVAQWTVDLSKPGEIERKIEELCWMAVIGFGVAGWTWAQDIKPDGREFHADFFQLHLATAIAFPGSILARMESPHCKIAFIRSCLAALIAQYVSRGKAPLNIAGFYRSPLANSFPLPYNELPTPSKDALPSRESIEARCPDPWLPLVQTTLAHPDTHLGKAVRTLAWLGARLGDVPQGTFGSPDVCPPGAIVTEMPGAEYLDGTLFIRVCGLMCKRMGRVQQGEDGRLHWDREGFWQDPVVAEEARQRMYPGEYLD